jgi:hypothetical protein
MARMTPEQIAIATAKRVAAARANRAAGIPSVRQQRAAAKAAKMAGQSYVPPTASSAYVPPVTPKAAPAPAFRKHGGYVAPAPSYRGVKLVALSAIEDAFILFTKEKGISQEARDTFAKYQKLKALALGNTTNSATQNEADAALRMAAIQLVKFAF